MTKKTLNYSESFPPKRVEDKRTKFEKERDHDWNYIQVVRHMLHFGSPDVSKEYLDHLEAHFEKRYGVTVDDYDI